MLTIIYDMERNVEMKEMYTGKIYQANGGQNFLSKTFKYGHE